MLIFFAFHQVTGVFQALAVQRQVAVTLCRAAPSGASLTGIHSPACRPPRTLRPGPHTTYIPLGQF